MKFLFNFKIKPLTFLGEYETFVAMVLDGYDHISDITDADGVGIDKVAKSRGHVELATFLENLREFEVTLVDDLIAKH